MNAGVFSRRCFIFMLVLLWVGSSWGQLLKVKRIDDGIEVDDPFINIRMMRHEIVGIEFKALFANFSEDRPYTASLIQYWGTNAPTYLEGWEDKVETVPAGTRDSIMTTIYLRPLDPISVGVDSFKVISMMRHGPNANDFLESYEFTVYIEVIDLTYNVPTILDEPQFTRGLSNSIYWVPTQSPMTQDVYCFDAEDPDDFKNSVKRLYRIAPGDTAKKVFEGLEDGHRYGYFAKAVYETTGEPISLYTDITYSTQDNLPPDKVLDSQVAVTDDNTVEVSWAAVNDQTSGVQSYQIYRAIDTGPEEPVAQITPVGLGPYLWEDTTVDTGLTYYYRVRGVDNVGNEGDGDLTSGIGLGGGWNEYIPPVDTVIVDTMPPVLTETYISCAKDTIWFSLDGREKRIRVQSARDSVDFLDNPPNIKMRVFDSGWFTPKALRDIGWVSPTNPDSLFFTFDYTDTGRVWMDTTGVVHFDTGGVRIDKNFVNGHTYYRQLQKEYHAVVTESDMGAVVPDCYPPTDIHNLRAQAIVDDPNFQDPDLGYNEWHFRVTWNAAEDAASGIKRYHIYRQVEGLDTTFVEVNIHDYYRETTFIDTLAKTGRDTVNNPVVHYRVVAEDNMGHMRSLSETAWAAQAQALGAPFIAFGDTSPLWVFPANPTEVDTIVTRRDTISLEINDFVTTDVVDYMVSINGDERVPIDISGNMIEVQLPDSELSTIRVRALYMGNRSSIWSQQKVVIKSMDIPPDTITVNSDSAYWKGNIYLSWERPSLDTRSYEVWRWDEAGDSTQIGEVASVDSAILWTDFYGMDELQDLPGDTLVAYEQYTYRVRKVSLFGDTTAFSGGDSAYCNIPPQITSHEIRDRSGTDIIIVNWDRVFRKKPSVSWSTRIRVSKDTLGNVIYITDDTTDPIDTRSYTYDINVLRGHNYIFEIQETPLAYADRPSTWSRPYTVSLATLDSLFLQPQPGGRMYVSWEEDTLTDRLPVTSYELCRTYLNTKLTFTFPDTILSYMDSVSLLHGRTYDYCISALDSLGQVVATNNKSAVCDTGLVFIPDSVHFKYFYFNDDSITVSWQWKDPFGMVVTDTTRGADSLLIQTSVSKNFPNIATVTSATGWFPADTLNRKRRIPIPEAANTTNSTVFCRITAKDRWNHPEKTLWSAASSVVLDPYFPNQVSVAEVSSVEAYYLTQDTVVTTFEWTGKGVEWPANASSATLWTPLIGNIAYYQVVRAQGSGADPVVVDEFPVHLVAGAIDTNHVYVYKDTLKNEAYKWRIVGVDSADNVVTSPWFEPEYQVPTPDPVEPSGFRACMIQPIASGSTGFVEYYVEIARNPMHFQYGYEFNDPDLIERTLCRSGWQDSLSFTCQTGWGGVVLDTTWFRVKARIDTVWESGWSQIVSYPPTFLDELTGIDSHRGLPTKFDVEQNMPNPFNAQTVIQYQMPQTGSVQIRIYSILGSLVRTLIDEETSAGYHSIIWDGYDDRGLMTSTGVYLYHVSVKLSNGKTMHRWKKMTMLK